MDNKFVEQCQQRGAGAEPGPERDPTAKEVLGPWTAKVLAEGNRDQSDGQAGRGRSLGDDQRERGRDR